MGLLDDAKSSVSKWFEEQVAKNKAFKAAGGMGKSNPAMTRSMGLLPATGLLEQEGDAAALADAAYGALRKEYGPLGLRPGDFVPFVSGGLAIDDARLAAAKGNYGQAAGSLAGVIPVAGAVGKVVRKITGGKSSGVVDSVKREIFAGPNAKTANKAAMKRAEARLAAGDDPATVWAQEGWGRGPDGKMRWEIDDSQAFPDLFGASDDYGKPLREGTLFPLNQSYEHQALYKSYPEIGDNVNIGFMPQERMGQAYGAYSGKHKRITLPDGEKRHFFEKSNLAHEVQHAVQDAEDFSRGGSPEGMRDEALAMLRRDVASGDIGSTEQAMNMLPMAQRNAYNRLAGEAESRLTEARIDMSPAERAAQYPWAEDYFKQATGVSKGDLIHRGGLLSDGPALSVGKADSLGIQGGTGSGTNTQNINRFETEADRRMAAAQRNAALPFEQGGLGLPAGNTPMDRARAMGFDVDNPLYHGTNKDISAFDPNAGEAAREMTGTNLSSSPEIANSYAGRPDGNVIPVLARTRGFDEIDFEGNNWNQLPPQAILRQRNSDEDVSDYFDTMYDDISTNDIGRLSRRLGAPGLLINDVADRGGYVRGVGDVPSSANNMMVFDPSRIRSRFAAFDPMRRNESDLLALNGQKTGSGLLNPEITKATNRGLYRTMLDDEEDKPSFPYGLIGK